ncbi:MAG: site-specific integrase [Deltaproteobacteria bacterium]|nr:site-specific integrase [Deltaproteobacteria bacterium]
MIDINITMPDGSIQRVRKVSPVQTKRAALQYEREVRQTLFDDRADGEEEETDEPKPKAPLFAAFVEEYLTNHAKLHNKPSSVRAKRSIYDNHLVPFFGKLRLDQIRPREIDRYKAKVIDRLHPKTINNTLTVLRRTLDVAARWGIIDGPPRIEWLRAPKPDFRFLDFDEADRLVEAAGLEPDWCAMIVLALNTGLRLGELLALPWSAVDLTAGRLRVLQGLSCGEIGTPKNGCTREVPLNDKATEALQQHRHLRGEFVFCRDDGSLLDQHACRYPLRRAWRKAGIPTLGWHDLRHTFASHLVMRGVPLKAVQELLGHATIEMTMRYAHLSPGVKRDAVRALDRPRHHSGTAWRSNTNSAP